MTPGEGIGPAGVVSVWMSICAAAPDTPTAQADRRKLAGALRRLDPLSLPQHVDALYRAAWGLCGTREDAEDLVQETFARILARPRLVRGDERRYLMRALRNTFVSRHRGAQRRPVRAAGLEDVEIVARRPDRQPEQAAEVGELLAAVARLPDDFRLAVAAVDILGLSYGEAARALGVGEATLATRIHRARRRLIAELEPGGLASPTAQSTPTTPTTPATPAAPTTPTTLTTPTTPTTPEPRR